MNAEAQADQDKVEEVEASAAAEVDANPAQEKEASAAEVDLAAPNDVAQDNEAANVGETENN